MFILLLVLPLSVVAQDKDLIKLSYRYTKISHTDTAKSFKTLDAYLTLPISNNDHQQVAASFGYRQVSINGFVANYPGLLYATTVRLGYQTRLDNRHQLRLFGQLGAYTDFQSFSSDVLRWTIGSEYIIRKQNDDKFGLGVAYSKQFYGHQILLLIELDKQFDDRWSIGGIFPVNPRLEYRLNNRSKMGIELNIEVNTFRFSSAVNKDQYLKTTQSTIALAYRYNVFRHWSIDVKAGISPKQEFGIYDQNAKSTWALLTIPLGDKPQAVQRFHNSAFSGQISLAYSIFQ